MGKYSPPGGVWIRNIVYREVFENHLGNIYPSTQYTTDFSQMDRSLNDTIGSLPEQEVPLINIEPVFLSKTVNSFTLCMRIQLADCVNKQSGRILAIRNTERNIIDCSLQCYYTSLKQRLTIMFGQSFTL